MSQLTIFFTITFVAIFLLYRYIERRFNIIERNLFNREDAKNPLNLIFKKIDTIKKLCSPLLLLNIFDEEESLKIGDDVYLNRLVIDFEEAEKDRVNRLEAVNKTEKQELVNFENENPNKSDFTPSLILKSDILAASTAIVLRQIIYKQLQTIKEIFFDVINGKLSIKEARKKAKLIANKQEYRDLKNTLDFPEDYIESIEDNSKVNPEVAREYKEFFAGHEKRWKNKKWKERLKWHREMENYEN